ncbi:MAG TPA: hypothetical protein VF132_04105 [Rudaea sp.]
MNGDIMCRGFIAMRLRIARTLGKRRFNPIGLGRFFSARRCKMVIATPHRDLTENP